MPWSTDFESGVLDNFDFTIKAARFAPDAGYNDGATTILQLDGITDDPDEPESHIWFPTGKGWSSPDGGKTIRHDSGRPPRSEANPDGKYIVKNSLFARLIDRCVNELNMGAVLDTRGNWWESRVWPGLKFHIKRETIDFGSGVDARSKPMPVKFLGVVGGSTTAAASGGVDPVAAARARVAANGVSARDQVKTLFAGHSDYDAAQAEALSLPGVTEDAALLDEILDPSRLWAEVNGATV